MKGVNNINTITELIKQNFEIAKSKGWYIEPRETGTLLMLMVSELAEAMEADRNSDKEPYVEIKLSIYDYNSLHNILGNIGVESMVCMLEDKAKIIDPKENFEEELADTVIRVMDFCGAKDINLEAAILKKMEVNKNRPYKHGGKKY